ncbi:DDE_3 domain-containing protein [Trichonephila clavipes]|nr:DDE_3 domain-containing protein [Trichonephila clavipes]
MPAEDRYIVLSAKKEQAHHSSAGGKSVSCCLRKADLPKNVARRLRGGGLYARRTVVCPIDQTAPYCPFAMVSKYPGKGPISGSSIMVWAGIMVNGRTRLHVVANGTMTGQRYIDEVLLPHDCLDSEGIQRLVWPARSPDLNPIENVCDALGRQVADGNYLPTNKNTLIRALTEEWDRLPQQLLDNVVQSMERRVECCITLQGGHIPY